MQSFGTDSIGATISSAEAPLTNLRKRLDKPVCWELKRRLIEVLVAGVQVDTVETDGLPTGSVGTGWRATLPSHV